MRYFLAIFVSCTLAACGSDSDSPADQSGNRSNNTFTLMCDSNASQALVGCWVSEGCAAVISSPGYYAQVLADFRNDGILAQGVKIYTDASCSGVPSVSKIPLQETYTVLGPVTTSGGLTAHYLSITIANLATNYAAFYIDASGRLCFPSDQFDVNGGGGGISPSYTSIPAASVTIDTASGACLISAN